MLFKMPWLKSRRRLLFLGIIDYSIILFSFYFLQKINFINTNLLAINLLAFDWILISYVLDKYSLVEDENKILIFNKFLRTIKIAIICGVFYKFFIIIFTIFNSNVGDGKWIIFIGLVSSISFFYEIIHTYIIKYFLSKPFRWISIHSDKKSSFFSKKEYSYEKYGFIKSLNISRIDDLNSLESEKYGLILEDIENLNVNEKEVIINLKNQGFKILSLIYWQERYLQRYPNEVLSSNYILNEILISQKTNPSQRIKRVSEFFLALLLLIILSPLIIISCIMIKLEDNGPVIYSQKRSGFGGKTFTIYKLRSMKLNAEKDGVKWSTKNDKRITRIGSILRKSRLDELPQLLSVIKGDMSLIGPRPERPEIDDLLITKIPNYKLRYLIRPGLSGWAQVNYPYGASVEDAKMKLSYDIYYIKNFSTLFDLLILMETIRLVVNFRGSQPKK